MQCDLQLQTWQVENEIQKRTTFTRRIVIPMAKSSPANAIHLVAMYGLTSISCIVSISIEMRYEKRLCLQARNCTYISKLSLVAEMHLCWKEKLMLSLVLESCKNFGSCCAKCLTHIFLYKSTELKSFHLSCTVSTLDAYHIDGT